MSKTTDGFSASSRSLNGLNSLNGDEGTFSELRVNGDISVSNTSAIAITSVVGVTVIGQPIAKFFQKQLKGQVKSFSKKITKKLLAIRGKKPPVKSLAERRKEQRLSRK